MDIKMDIWQGKNILITGGAGFIGFHVAQRLLKDSKSNLIVVDNVNDYYSTDLKWNRLRELGIDENGNSANARVKFYKINIADRTAVEDLYERHKFDAVIHLAAQAGVRYSLVNPNAYIDSNISGFFNIINGAAQKGIKLFLYASTSSVYGDTKKIPFEENASFTTPLSLYAATKMSNEQLAATFSHNYQMDCIGVRFFNIYGPWGRPDGAYYIWADALREGKPVEVRGEGKLQRDMTYIEDAVQSILGLAHHYYQSSKETPACEVYNIGNRNPVVIHDVLDHLAKRLNRSPKIKYVDKGREEIDTTNADTSKLKAAIGFAPNTPVKQGLDSFIEWYKEYYGI